MSRNLTRRQREVLRLMATDGWVLTLTGHTDRREAVLRHRSNSGTDYYFVAFKTWNTLSLEGLISWECVRFLKNGRKPSIRSAWQFVLTQKGKEVVKAALAYLDSPKEEKEKAK